MSYQVIARKWRPQTFEEVTGQEPITRTLRNAIEHERLHHAYLFSGARGVGKTTTARLLAKALNCHKTVHPTPNPCSMTDANACVSCREIAEGRSMDVLEIDAASHTQVENIREVIISSIGIAPARDRYKIFIIDEVHMLSGHSFNALLKTIEEPPPRVVFIMATTESHKIPATILSRSQQFEFRTIAAAKIFERLRLIADAERIQVSDDALREIARAGEGSMRDAQSAFDQVISFSTEAIEVADVETALGIAGAEMRARVMRAVAEQKPADALAVVEDLVMRGHDLRNFCRDLLAHVRDLLVVKVAGGRIETDDLAEAERRELAREGEAFAESDLVRFFHSLTETEKALRESAHPRYQLEIGLVKLIEMRRLAPLAQILERLSALEESLRTGKAPAADSGPASTPPASTPATGGGTSGAPPRRTTTGGRSSSSSSKNDAVPFPVAQDGSDAPQQERAANPIPNDAETPPFEPPPRRTEPATTHVGSTTPRIEPTPPRVEPPPARVEATPRVESPAAKRPAPPSIPSLPKRPATAIPSLPASVSAPPPPPSSGLKLVPPSVGETNNAIDGDWRATSSEARTASAQVRAPSSFFDDAPAENQDGQSDWFRADDDPQGKQNAASSLENHHAGAFTYVNAATQTPRTPVAPPSVAAAAPARPAKPTNDTLEQLKKLLDERRKPLLISALEGARKAMLEGDDLYVEYAPEGKHLRDALSKPDNIKILREVCREATGRDMGVRIVVKEAGEGDDAQLTQEDEARQEKQKLREMAEQDPFVQKVLRTFRAEIIDVRRVEPEDVEASQSRPL